MTRLLTVLALLPACMGTAKTAPFQPVSVEVKEDAFGRVVRAIEASGLVVATSNPTRGQIETPWEQERSRRLRWRIVVQDGRATVISECEELIMGNLRPCSAQPSDRVRLAQSLALMIVNQAPESVALAPTAGRPPSLPDAPRETPRDDTGPSPVERVLNEDGPSVREERKEIEFVPPAPPKRHAWWCLSAMGADISICVRSQEECDRLGDYLMSRGTTVTDCNGEDVAACYRVRENLHKKDEQRCFAKLSHCADSVASTKKKSQDWTVLTTCAATK